MGTKPVAEPVTLTAVKQMFQSIGVNLVLPLSANSTDRPEIDALGLFSQSSQSHEGAIPFLPCTYKK